MSTLTLKNGVAPDLQRIEQELEDQRAQLDADVAQFDAWRQRWNDRQAAIDRSLAQLQQRLG